MSVDSEAAATRQVSADKWAALALRLGVEEAALRAVAQVESRGSGFLADGKPKILFEGHIFHRLTHGRYSASAPQISYPKWDRKKYTSPNGEWKRLEAAASLDADAALQSASWGAFQIMGFNYAACGCENVSRFVELQHQDADGQVECFARLLSRPGSPLIAASQKRDWAKFARLYNGPEYAKNAYDVKLRTAYEAFAGQTKAASGAAKKQAPRSTKANPLAPGRPEVLSLDLVPVAKSPRKRRTPTLTFSVRPDSVDLRDWEYRPPVGKAPAEEFYHHDIRPTHDQGDSNACTGFALAVVIEYLLDSAGRHVERISPYMLYSMARRYDEWADNDEVDDPDADTGSSLRGALKGWHGHGASVFRLWKTATMPPPAPNPQNDWWMDAIQRPLGAYYRIDPTSIRDMHIALNETGAIYASALVHSGWTALLREETTFRPVIAAEIPKIDRGRGRPDQGHAFAIVGYTKDGFIVQNSWGENWGGGGLGVLTYSDWLDNAMDCWVAQLGVVTSEHVAIATAASLRTDKDSKHAVVSSNPRLARHEVSPFVINMENNGRLSRSGQFRTQPSDIDALLSIHLAKACSDWGISPDGTVDVAIYAHGGLNDEEAAAKSAADWIPKFYDAKIFPVFLMWETGALKTVFNMIEDRIAPERGATRAAWIERIKKELKDWWNERIEAVARPIARPLWSEMKENAEKISSNPDSGVQMLFKAYRAYSAKSKLPKLRVHLIGHSAGAIVHTYLGKAAVAAGFDLSTVSLIAPAVRVDTFDRVMGPVLSSRGIPLLIAHLTDPAERSDDTCKPYGHSLLYLVSRAFEEKHETAILGMERFLGPARAAQPWGSQTVVLPSPQPRGSTGVWTPDRRDGATEATTHGSLDDDSGVQAAVLELIHRRQHVLVTS